ncbi:MAG: cytochrome C, partial [Gammaproteobacteria bacterium]|nr:cytochrome C [Gammaproteobacteria bacterium]
MAQIPFGYANSLELLLMPGPVIKAHAEHEHDCNKCHDTSGKSRQSLLCMQCHDHKNILNDVREKKGFHGRLAASIRNKCKHCHTEHKGRDAKVILLDLSTFDHTKTDFQLKGVHARTSCRSCHKPDKKYAEAPRDCYSCHKTTDVHKGKNGKKCGDCHSASTWKQSAFDHDKKTDFPLKGAHKQTNCSSCHINQKYKDTPKKCTACHKIHDIHQGGYGAQCDACHTSEQWDDVRFDHNKKTDFPLHGQHKKASCNSCHTPEKLRKNKHKKLKLPTDCYSCHKHDDNHKGKHGKEC